MTRPRTERGKGSMTHDADKRLLLYKCQCSMRTRLVGDGCQYCNPQYWAQFVRPKSYRKEWLRKRLA